MNKILDKISVPKTHLVSADLTAEQKEQLYRKMECYGANRSLTYARFFRDGFDRWELEGIDSLCTQFIEDYKEELVKAYIEKFNVHGTVAEMSVLMVDYVHCQPLHLLDLCYVVRGLQSRLFEYFDEAGLSRSTCYVRLPQDRWKPWEREGVVNICKQLAYGESSEREEVGCN